MSNLKYMNINTLGHGKVSMPAPDRLLEGEPEFTTWPLLDEGISTGVWGASPGYHRVIRDQTIIEAFLILEGEIELFEDGNPESRHFGTGDLVVIRPGFTGSWRTLKAMRKVYCTATL